MRAFDRLIGVSRIGRTGRAGASGSAYTFFTPANARLAKQLKGILEEAKQPVPAQLAKYALVTLGLHAGDFRTLLLLRSSQKYYKTMLIQDCSNITSLMWQHAMYWLGLARKVIPLL